MKKKFNLFSLIIMKKFISDKRSILKSSNLSKTFNFYNIQIS